MAVIFKRHVQGMFHFLLMLTLHKLLSWQLREGSCSAWWYILSNWDFWCKEKGWCNTGWRTNLQTRQAEVQKFQVWKQVTDSKIAWLSTESYQPSLLFNKHFYFILKLFVCFIFYCHAKCRLYCNGNCWF